MRRTTYRLFCTLLVLLVFCSVVTAPAMIALGQEENASDPTENDSAVNESESEVDAESAEDDESEGDGNGGGDEDESTSQVRLFEQGENQPAISPEDTLDSGDTSDGDGSEGEGEGEAGNDSGNESSGEATLGDLADSDGAEDESDDDGMAAFERPSASSVTDEIIGRIAGLMYEAGITMINDVFNEMLGTPVPENNGYRGVLGYPEPGSGQYADLYHDYYLPIVIPPLRSAFVILLGIVCFYMVPTSPFTGVDVKKTLLMIFAGAAVIVASWEIASIMHFASDAVTQHFLPDGEDILNHPDSGNGIGTLETTSGAIGMLLGISIFGWNVGLFLLAIHGARHVLLSILPAFIGVIFLLQWFGPAQSRKFGSMGFWGYVGLLAMNWPTAALLGAAHVIAFRFGLEGASGTAADAGVTIGLFTIATFLPVMTQLSFFLGPLFLIKTKGGVAKAAVSSVSRRTGPGSGGWREKWGGQSHPEPTRTQPTRSASQDTRRRRAVTDGGATPPTALPHSSASRSSASATAPSTTRTRSRDRTGARDRRRTTTRDERRRDLYNQMRAS